MGLIIEEQLVVDLEYLGKVCKRVGYREFILVLIRAIFFFDEGLKKYNYF